MIGTHIRVKRSTLNKLKKIQKKNQSLDDVLNSLWKSESERREKSFKEQADRSNKIDSKR